MPHPYDPLPSAQACMLDMWRDRSLTCDGCGNAHDREQLEGTLRSIIIIIYSFIIVCYYDREQLEGTPRFIMMIYLFIYDGV